MRDAGALVKRPLLLIGAAFFVAAWVLTQFGQKWFAVALLTAVCVVGFAAVFVRRMRAVVLVVTFLTVAWAFFSFVKCENEHSYLLETLPGQNRTVVGQVYEKQESDNGTVCIVRAAEVDGMKTDCKMRVHFRHIRPDKLEKYVEMVFKADVSEPKDDPDSYKLHLRSEGVSVCADCFQKEVAYHKEVKNSFLYGLDRIKTNFCKAVTDFIPNENGKLILAFVFGEQSELSDKTAIAFRVCGLSHLMAVSGLHVYTWSHALFICLISFVSKRKAALSSIAFTLFFAALTGFSPSVVRAGIMMSFIYAGYIFLKVSDSMNSLGAALLVMCAANPYIVHSVGLQLSFSAAFGLALMSDRIAQIKVDQFRFERIGKLIEIICRSALVCAVATLFTLPATVFRLGGLSLMGIVANVLCVSISMFVMILGGFGAVLASLKFTSFLGLPLLLAAGFLSKIIIAVVTFLGQFDFLYINVDYPQVKVCVAVLAVAAVIVFIFKPDFFKNKYLVAFTAANTAIVSVIITNAFLALKGVS